MVYVDWHEANEYCKWAKCGLPSEEEWQFAAQGPEKRKYAWGAAEPNEDLANFGNRVGHVTPVGLFPASNSSQGIHDMTAAAVSSCTAPIGVAFAGEMASGRTLVVQPISSGSGFAREATIDFFLFP